MWYGEIKKINVFIKYKYIAKNWNIYTKKINKMQLLYTIKSNSYVIK